MAAYERILVTGGAGFVGSHLCAALALFYPAAQRLCLMRPDERGVPLGFEAVVGDLLDERLMDGVIAQFRPDLIVHLAGQSSIGQASKAAEQTWRVNFHGAFGLAAAIARHTPAAVVLFASSATVYGLSFREGILTEAVTPRPLESYGRSKLAAENALSDILAEEGRLIIARPVNHSGPGQRSRDFVLASFAAQIAAIEAGAIEPILKVGDLSRARDFLDVRDVVDAYMRLIATAAELPDRISIFNIASGAARSIGSILDEFRSRSKRPFEIEVDPQRLRSNSVDIISIACDATKLSAVTAWRPQYSMGDLVEALLEESRSRLACGDLV
jgi:GDP-4-dehydro-6-deoxy-D-mannose reductase